MKLFQIPVGIGLSWLRIVLSIIDGERFADLCGRRPMRLPSNLARCIPARARYVAGQRAAQQEGLTLSGLNSLAFLFSPRPGHFPANFATIYSYPDCAVREKTEWCAERHSNLR
jgi:hypothetical protein